MQDLKTNIAKNITELRILNNMTQMELGEKLNYSDKTISKWERGESTPDISTLSEIADLFGVSLDFLVKSKNIEENATPKVRNEGKYNRRVISYISESVAWIVAIFAFIITMQNYFAKGFLQSLKIIFLVSVLYSIYAAIMILKNHGKFGLGRIMALYSVPIIYGTAFSCLEGIVTSSNGIYYLLLLLNFSSVCDMGAYFVGVTLGKHKLCPKISPKKTVEGAIGGILASLIVTMILSLYFDKTMWIMLIATIPFCILGMIGDLFASAIKRAVDIKDYGNLIPGHGGVMDRLDSIIMIVPTMYALILLSVI